LGNPVIHFLSDDVRIEAEEGASLLETARRAGFVLTSECGGQGTCRRCKVRLLSGDVFLTGEPNISAEERAQNVTLACMARVVEDLEVEVPQESELAFAPEAIRTPLSLGEHPGEEVLSRKLRIDPHVKTRTFKVPQPTLQNNASDFERLTTALKSEGFQPPFQAGLKVLSTLSQTLHAESGSVTATVCPISGSTEILHITPGEEENIFGLALDIGTTTVFARLINLATGEVAAEASEYNRQIPCGGDIIHRIVYASKAGGLEELNKLVLESANSLIGDMLKETGATSEQVVASVLAGNATMQHLFLGMDPKTIREEPYVPTVTHFPVLHAGEIGLGILPRAPLFFSPSVASYVGGDVTAGLLAAGVHRSDRLTLYVDLGTNGEVALGNKDWLTACACSAGPAFEGSGVRCGMRALPGGIDRVELDAETGDLSFRVIGGGTPKGICGSGLIDLLAELRGTGRISARGKFDPDADPRRIRKKSRKAEMLLIDQAQTGGAGDIVVTDTDLDNLIRTKGAIFAGIMTLLKGVGLKASDIQRVVIAGGFGRTLDVENAIRIGLFPDLPRKRFEYIGNGSLRGAGLALLSRQLWDELHEIARMITYFELSSWPGYMDEFMAALFLPHTDGGLFPSVK
jgi:uncharacterized 2Fe-2S/4Fe-4S cluster protein (DUF4445 family)